MNIKNLMCFHQVFVVFIKCLFSSSVCCFQKVFVVFRKCLFSVCACCFHQVFVVCATRMYSRILMTSLRGISFIDAENSHSMLYS